jgi:hypothetical protein
MRGPYFSGKGNPASGRLAVGRGVVETRKRPAMMIKITLSKKGERWEGSSDFPAIEAASASHDRLIACIKGACLHVLGEWENVPDQITFTYAKGP